MRFVFFILLCAIAVTAADISFSGDAQYRFRHQRLTFRTAVDSTVSDLTHRYAWSLRAKVKAHENLEFGIKFCNPSGSSTDPIIQNDSFPGSKNAAPIVMREFYFRWSTPVASLTAVRIPVPASTVLELTAYESMRYVEVGSDDWGSLTDNALNGLVVDVTTINAGHLTLRPSFLTAMALDPGVSILEPVERNKLDQWKFMFSVQTGLLNGALLVTPIGHLRTAIAQSADGSGSNHAAATGVDIKAIINQRLTLTAGFAAGGYTNDAQAADTTVQQEAPSGVLLKLGASVKPGFGVLKAGLRFGRWNDELLTPGRSHRLIFGSLKYGLPVRNLIIEPRLRGYYYFDNQTDVKKIKIRSELSFIASF